MLIFAASFAPVGSAEEKKPAHGHGAAAAPGAAVAEGEIPRSASPKGARCYIIAPKDGATVKGEFVVKFGLRGMGVAPAGVDIPNTGNHHLLINTDEYDPDAPLPVSEQSVHFGGGQTETKLSLPPGEHTLMLVLGDKLHIPHQPPVASKKITITVEAGEKEEKVKKEAE